MNKFRILKDMVKRPNKNLLIVLITTMAMFVFTLPVNAQCFNGWLPDVIEQYICNPSPERYIEARVRTLFLLAVGIIILFAIAMGLKASFKLITSGGKAEKQEEAFNGIKGIFMGIAFLFIIMMAIPIVLGFFGYNFQDMVSGVTICVKAPESAGCYACTHKNLLENEVDNKNLCSICDTDPTATITYPVTEEGYIKGSINCSQSLYGKM